MWSRYSLQNPASFKNAIAPSNKKTAKMASIQRLPCGWDSSDQRLFVTISTAPLTISAIPSGTVVVEDDELVVARSTISQPALRAGGEKFDLVLCDLMMPDMTGMELDRELDPAGLRSIIHRYLRSLTVTCAGEQP